MTVDASPDKPDLPRSATDLRINLIVLGVVMGCTVLIRTHHLTPNDEVLFMVGAAAIPIVLLDVLVLKVHRRESTGLDWDRSLSFDPRRVLTKLLGLVVTIAPLAIAYVSFPEYANKHYEPFFALLRRVWPWLAVGAPLYIAAVDGRMREPHDAYWQLGRVALGDWGDARKADIANHFRGWIVKAFYFPLMFSSLSAATHTSMTFDISGASWSNLRAYEFFHQYVFSFVDVLFAAMGYAMSLRLVDTHIRSAEPTMLGWVAAISCYRPFFHVIEQQYLHYDTNNFVTWLAPHPMMRWAWAFAVCVLITIYSLSTVVFGLRFSNLTHRGILTNGPYRFTKHPAYVAKNLSWWLATVPFVVNDGNYGDALKRCLQLSLVNLIYFVRARTEERHLSRDPVYVRYALWMNEHGVLRFLNRFPIFQYKPPPG